MSRLSGFDREDLELAIGICRDGLGAMYTTADDEHADPVIRRIIRLVLEDMDALQELVSMGRDVRR